MSLVFILLLCLISLNNFYALVYKGFHLILYYLPDMCLKVFKNLIIILETLLLIPTIGIQEITYFVSGKTNLKFYNFDDINNVIINENITMVLIILSRKKFTLKWSCPTKSPIIDLGISLFSYVLLYCNSNEDYSISGLIKN